MGSHISIKNPFGELPPVLEQNDLEYLVRLVRAGVATHYEKHELFLGHVRLALSLVSRYAWRTPHLINDLISAAMLAIADAIVSAETVLTNNNITYYITAKIKAAIIDEMMIYGLVPGRRIREQLANGTVAIPKYVVLTNHLDLDNSFDLYDTMEVIAKCVDQEANLNHREYKRVIIRLRAAGYNNIEIADIIEISKSQVQAFVSEMKKVYYELVNEND